MHTIAFKMLFRKKGTASTVLAIALLIALITSVSALVNNINSQATTLGTLARIGETYLITDKNSNSLLKSKIDANIADAIRNVSEVKYVLPQKLIPATLTATTGNYPILIRAVDEPQTFFNMKKAHINGIASKNQSHANVGKILSNLASINKNDNITLTINDSSTIKVQIVGITTTNDQSDTDIILPIITLNELFQKNDNISYIELALKDTSTSARNNAINQITQILPSNAQITKVQQIDTFAQDMNNQTLSFLNLWSIVIYTVVAAASYVIATKLITESKYELSMLKIMGAKRSLTSKTILAYTIILATTGAILGIAIGIVGAQVASTTIRWMFTNISVAPFIEVNQIIQILLLSFVSSIVGCIYPALKVVQKATVENFL